jgi:hypothetical protein
MFLSVRTRRLAAALVVSWACTGCYAYLPAGGTFLAGQPVQATLTDSGAVVLASRIGPAVQQLRGRMVSQQAGAISLAIDEAQQRDGVSTPWRGEVVDVPRSLIAAVEVRRFSATRTALFSALLGTALVSLERGFLRGGGTNAPGSGQTGTPASR